MAKKKAVRKKAAAKKAAPKKSNRKKTTRRRASTIDSADGVAVGEEPVPGMRLRAICRGHQGTIGRIAWSPSGRFIASPSSDKTIRIWDANDGNCLLLLEGHYDSVRWVTWAPDGETLASASDDKTVRLWRLASQLANPAKRLIRIKHAVRFPDGSDQIRSVAWSPDGTTIAVGLQGGGITYWDTNSGNSVQSFRAYQNATLCLAWSPKGDKLAAGGGAEYTLKVFKANSEKVSQQYEVHNNSIWGIAWSPDAKNIVSASSDNTIAVHDVVGTSATRVLESHTDGVTSISFSPDGQLLASKSYDGSVKLWKTDEWLEMANFSETAAGDRHYDSGLGFSPNASRLASLGERDQLIRVWDLDVSLLLSSARRRAAVRYTSAKIVLVGESNVGKSCLAMRLAEDRYPDDHEHGTTHGMRFWPMEAEDLHPAAKPPEGQRRDVVLWDFGGQDEYQLVHQMFLHDTTLALVLIDPTRGRAALDEARDWNKRLEKHLGKDRAVKLLVGAKVDRKRDLIDQNSIDALCEECGFAAFLDLSAKKDRNIKKLRKLISDQLDWDQMAKTSRPELFQHIRDDVEARRKKKQIVLTLDAFKKAIKRSAAKLYEEAAVDAVSDQLATQGIIVRTKLTGGDETLVLQLPVIERYAGSLIIAARNNPRGVPVLEERLLGSTKTISLPGMTKKERLSPAKERMVLECIVELMIHNGICFRHGGLLVFPTLFPAGGTDDEKLPHSVSLYYDFTGAIDNIYASLVSKLMVGDAFGEGRLLAGRVEFDRPRQGMCGIRQIKRSGGLAHVDVFFSAGTSKKQRDLFIGFVEKHLADNGIDIQEHRAITCRCGEEIAERIVHANIVRGEKDVVCPVCRTKILISEGIARIRERDPESDQKILALRKTIEERTARDVAIAKSRVSQDTTLRKGEPIRVLHLSDLHFTEETSTNRHLVPLLQDIRNGDFLGFRSVEYLVISGDMTDKGGDAGFDKAREFVESLIDEMDLSVQRCILLPGNHDVQDIKEAHQKVEPAGGGKKVMARHPENYRKRFLTFSQAFYHKVIQQPYPLDFAEQGISYLFPNNGVQFLALNSAWQIDKYGRNNSGIHPDAVTGVVQRAGKEIEQAYESSDLKKSQPVLRIAVWHHALEGAEAMQDDAFLENFQAAGVQICLHGDVHESRRKLVNSWDKGGVHIVGAGTFGSPEAGRPESTPRLYNLLEIQSDLKSVRVHTRQQRKAEGAWKGWNEWPDPDGGQGNVPFFDIDL